MKIVQTFVVLAVLVSTACKPSPDDIDLSSTTHPLDGRSSVTLQEGDVMVLDAKPYDDNDEMDLCVTASSSAPDVLTVQRVKNKCRLFVLSPKRAGQATIAFRARDGESRFSVDVVP